MIIVSNGFRVWCDLCGGFVSFGANSFAEAEEAIRAAGWKIDDSQDTKERHLCPECRAARVIEAQTGGVTQ